MRVPIKHVKCKGSANISFFYKKKYFRGIKKKSYIFIIEFNLLSNICPKIKILNIQSFIRTK